MVAACIASGCSPSSPAGAESSSSGATGTASTTGASTKPSSSGTSATAGGTSAAGTSNGMTTSTANTTTAGTSSGTAGAGTGTGGGASSTAGAGTSGSAGTSNGTTTSTASTTTAGASSGTTGGATGTAGAGTSGSAGTSTGGGTTASPEFYIDPWMSGLNCSDPNYKNYVEPYMVAHPGGYLVFTIRWASNDTGTTAPNYTWGADGASGLLSCVPTANGGTYTGAHPQPIELLLWVATNDTGTPAYNYGTPIYVYDPTYAASVGASRPNDSLMCAEYPASGIWTNASHYYGDGAGFTTTQLSQGLPVPWETPFMTARNAYMTAAFAHYSGLLGSQLYRLKPGMMAGSTDEQHDVCAAQQDVLPGISPSGTIGTNVTGNGLWAAWMSTIDAFLANDTSPANNPSGIPLVYSINRENQQTGQWMDDEAALVASYGAAIGYQGVTQADVSCWLGGDPKCSEYWQYIFGFFSASDVQIQTAAPTRTDGTGEGTMTEILPELLQACGDSQRRCDFEQFSVDVLCETGQPGYSSSTCAPTDTYYPLYPLLTTLLTPCEPTGSIWGCGYGSGAESVWDTSQTCNGTSCTYGTQTVSPSFGSYQDATGGIHAISGGTVPVGSEPVLLFP
ncbi:MAG TPA: hypothetical protein VMB50_22255 [Myxococcales bacterium]|nr:hypothetical protein [Myxococcales bacterium]